MGPIDTSVENKVFLLCCELCNDIIYQVFQTQEVGQLNYRKIDKLQYVETNIPTDILS